MGSLAASTWPWEPFWCYLHKADCFLTFHCSKFACVPYSRLCFLLLLWFATCQFREISLKDECWRCCTWTFCPGSPLGRKPTEALSVRSEHCHFLPHPFLIQRGFLTPLARLIPGIHMADYLEFIWRVSSQTPARFGDMWWCWFPSDLL